MIRLSEATAECRPIADNGLVGTPIDDIIPLEFRGKQSRDAWSSCGSCHAEGLADGVTFLDALDGRTPIFRSETDDFHEPASP